MATPPEKWIYFGVPGDVRPMAAIVSRAWVEWRQQIRRERKWVDRQEALSHLFDRDGSECGICHEHIEDIRAAHVDHIMPLSKGGHSDFDNLQLAHADCNIRKGAAWEED